MIKLIQMYLLCLRVCHKLWSTTCLHSYTSIYSKYDIIKKFPNTSITLNNSLSNLLIPSQRLVTRLCTQTVLHCLIIQVLNIKSLLPKYQWPCPQRDWRRSAPFSFYGEIDARELEQGLLSQKEPHVGRGDTYCPCLPRGQHATINACIHDWCLQLLIMVFLFLPWSSFEVVAQISCTSTLSSLSVVCGVVSGFANHYICMSHHIWFCEPLNFHCNKLLLQKYFHKSNTIIS